MKISNYIIYTNYTGKFHKLLIVIIVVTVCSTQNLYSRVLAATTTTTKKDSLYVTKNDSLPVNAIWLESMDVSKIAQLNGKPAVVGKAFTGTPIMLNGQIYKHGIGVSAVSFIRINLKKSAKRFITDFNIDDAWKTKNLRTHGVIYVDGKKVYETEKPYWFKWPQSPYQISINLEGASELVLAVMADGIYNGHCDWAGAHLILEPGAKLRPEIIPMSYSNIDIENPNNTVWLDKVPSSFISSGNGKGPGFWRTPQGNAISLNGQLYSRGYAVCPNSILKMNLKGVAERFVSLVGVNDDSKGSAVFKVFVDKELKFESGEMHPGDSPKPIDIKLNGAKEMLLHVASNYVAAENVKTFAAWVGPRIFVTPGVTGKKDLPEPKMLEQKDMNITTIIDDVKPVIHGPRVTGSSPDLPFFFAVPATGEKPLKFSATNLPDGLSIDPATGFITGKISTKTQKLTEITVSNRHGKDKRYLTIICKPRGIALTPPMGWNNWNQWGDKDKINDEKMKQAADLIISKGYASHGYQYVNLDDTWSGPRITDGTLTPKEGRFSDMKALGDYIHSKGLKFGIYGSPGEYTCNSGHYLGSLGHEQQDAYTWASWGVDYLKYDGCSGGTLERWKLMRIALDNTKRDIVYSTNTCRDSLAGAQLWRTTPDIYNSWTSMGGIGFSQNGLEKFSGPGRYNDPDMLVVGNPENVKTNSPLTHNEQITHITLWSMLAAPLLIGCDLSKTDDFLYSLLCNDDVLEIDQDPIVRQAWRLRQDIAVGMSDFGGEVWVRPLFDGTMAVAFFNRGSEPVKIAVSWKELGLEGKQQVRDCWMRKNMGTFSNGYEANVEVHAAVLIKVGVPKTDKYIDEKLK